MLSEAIFKLDNENNSCHWHQSRTISNTQNIFFPVFCFLHKNSFWKKKKRKYVQKLKKNCYNYTQKSATAQLWHLYNSLAPWIPFLQLIWMILCSELWESMSFNHSSGKLSSLLFKKTFHNFTLKINLTLQNYFERPTAPNHNLINELMTFT